MNEPGFEDKFVAFIDVMGFKRMIEAAERGEGRSVAEILEIMDELGNEQFRQFILESGPMLCPTAPRVRDDLAFEVTQVSDCAVISAEVSPSGVINLISHCSGAILRLMSKGVLVRGYVTRGPVLHRGGRLLGTGYHHAYAKESAGITAFKMETDEKGTPFVEIDDVVLDYVRTQGNECVRSMFSRLVESDGAVSAIYPFKRLQHSFAIGGFGMNPSPFDPEKEKRSNDVIRGNIRSLIERITHGVDPANTEAIKKTRHYVAALEKQLVACDRTDEIIDGLSRPVGRGLPHQR